MESDDARNTSPAIDPAELGPAQKVRRADTSDAASEVVKRGRRQALLALPSRPGVLELGDPDVMAGAWR